MTFVPGDLRALAIELGVDLVEVAVCARWCVDVDPFGLETRVGMHHSPDPSVRCLYLAAAEQGDPP